MSRKYIYHFELKIWRYRHKILKNNLKEHFRFKKMIQVLKGINFEYKSLKKTCII